jgi:hypothetical protein
LAAPSSNPTFTGTATFDSVTANAVSLGDVTTSDLTVSGAFTSVGIDDNATSTAITITNGNVSADKFTAVGSNSDQWTYSVRAPVPSDYWAAEVGAFMLFPDLGMLATQGSFQTALTSNGYRNTSGKWTSLGADGEIGASQLVLAPTGKMDFRTSDNQPSGGEHVIPTRMTISALGNVGIGVTDPQKNLTVKGTAGRRISFGDSGTANVSEMRVHNDADSNFGFMEYAAYSHTFTTGTDGIGAERMSIGASGTTTVTGGFEAAQPGAGTGAFAAGDGAGVTNQGPYSIAVGRLAGNSSQGTSTVAIGNTAGQTSQGGNSIAVGKSAGESTQGGSCVAVGSNAGNSTQGASAVAVGYEAGKTTQGANAVAVGVFAGQTTQGFAGVGIGSSAGKTNQGDSAVAVGRDAGESTQGANATAVGYGAGRTNQGSQSVAVGLQSGSSSQGEASVSLGYAAGMTGQGDNSIAIGNRAGQTNQAANGIIINSSGSASNMPTPNHIMLATAGSKYLSYNGTDTWTFAGGDVTVPNNNLLVGKTTSNTSANGIELYDTGQAWMKTSTATPVVTDRGNAGEMMAFLIAGTKKGLITQPASGAPSFAAASDERLKDNIVDHESELANVMSLRPTRWEWKDGSGTGEGFIAQEVEQTGWSDLVGEDVDSGFKNLAGLGTVETRLIKAMQEQQAMIEALKAEVEALKNA